MVYVHSASTSPFINTFIATSQNSTTLKVKKLLRPMIWTEKKKSQVKCIKIKFKNQMVVFLTKGSVLHNQRIK